MTIEEQAQILSEAVAETRAARKNICAVFKEKTLERVLAEARVILAGRKL